MMQLSDLQKATGGQVLSQHQTSFTGVGTDTRQDLSGLIFVALRGDRFDAHDFLNKALDQKAAALLVDREPPAEVSKLVTVVKVPDTLKALQDFGHYWRKKQKAKVIGITGSNGKTTTKQFLATLLKEQFATLSNEGSFNNHWGVPLTLLKIRAEHEMAVVEMGMNHAGEITRLCEIAEPDVVAVTMVGRAHIEYFGTIENIAKAKEEIYISSPPKATRVFNLDNPHTKLMWEHLSAPGKVLTFSAHQKSDVELALISSTLEGLHVKGQIGGVSGEAQIPVFGEQNLNNAQAAAALALACGVSPEKIWKGLCKCGSAWGRNQWLRLPNGARVLFDAYNANPDSMKALLENTMRMPHQGRKLAVLGEMRELGDSSSRLHEELGELAAHVGFEMIYFVGNQAQAFESGLRRAGFQHTFLHSAHCDQSKALEVSAHLNANDVVVVKGSRGVHLEEVVQAWKPKDFQAKY